VAFNIFSGLLSSFADIVRFCQSVELSDEYEILLDECDLPSVKFFLGGRTNGHTSMGP
jgi:hypothetical protein